MSGHRLTCIKSSKTQSCRLSLALQFEIHKWITRITNTNTFVFPIVLIFFLLLSVIYFGTNDSFDVSKEMKDKSISISDQFSAVRH